MRSRAIIAGEWRNDRSLENGLGLLLELAADTRDLLAECTVRLSEIEALQREAHDREAG